MSRLKLLIFSFITLLILVLSYFLYSKYFSRIRNQDIVLSEDHEEYKRKPVDPGGIVIPNSGSLIYEKLNPSENSGNEIDATLQSETEEPINLGFKADVESDENYDSIDDILANLDLPEDKADQTTTSSEEVKQALAPSTKNENEPLTPYVSDESDSSENEDNIMPELVDNSSNKNNNSALIAQDQNKNSHNLKIIQVEEQNNKLHNLNLQRSKDSGYKIHLSSAWSEKEAKNEWQKIKTRHPKYLDKTELIVKKVTANNGKIIYLVMAGNYPSLDKAKLVCKKLNLSNQNCIVTK